MVVVDVSQLGDNQSKERITQFQSMKSTSTVIKHTHTHKTHQYTVKIIIIIIIMNDGNNYDDDNNE